MLNPFYHYPHYKVFQCLEIEYHGVDPHLIIFFTNVLHSFIIDNYSFPYAYGKK